MEQSNISYLKNITIDEEFESTCIPLTVEEFDMLEENILTDGEVTNPLIVWNNTLIDGHHRRKIILEHPEIPFYVKEFSFSDRYEAISWICKNQMGRRNMTPEQLTYLIGKRYEAEKKSVGSPGKYDETKLGQFDPIREFSRTSERIARDYGISEVSVRRAGDWAKGVDAADMVCPGTKQDILFSALKTKKPEVIALGKLPADEIPNAVYEMRKAQEEAAEKRRMEREEKRRKLEETEYVPKTFSSISEISAYLEEPKRRNNVSNVLGIIDDMAQTLQATCESYIGEFPSLLEKDKPLLIETLSAVKEYLDELFEEC